MFLQVGIFPAPVTPTPVAWLVTIQRLEVTSGWDLSILLDIFATLPHKFRTSCDPDCSCDASDVLNRVSDREKASRMLNTNNFPLAAFTMVSVLQ